MLDPVSISMLTISCVTVLGLSPAIYKMLSRSDDTQCNSNCRKGSLTLRTHRNTEQTIQPTETKEQQTQTEDESK